MRFLWFAAPLGVALVIAPRAAAAQAVPGRDLFDFTVGALAEAPALAIESAGGLYNPATLLLAPVGRLRASVAHLNAQGDRGLTGEVLGVEWRARPRLAGALSVARIGLSGIPLTTESPDVMPGMTVAYDSFVFSGGVAYRPVRHIALGGALRYRAGRVDTVRAGRAGADAGIVIDGLLGRHDLRLGASTFLWRPRALRDDRPLGTLGADARVVGSTVAREVRLGASYLGSRGGERETYGYITGRLRNVEGRAGLARAARADGDAESRVRLGLGLRYARFHVAIAREEGESALGSIYQFTLSTLLK